MIEIVLSLIEMALKREGEAALGIGGRQVPAMHPSGVNEGRTILHAVIRRAHRSLAVLLRIGGLRLRHVLVGCHDQTSRRHQQQSP